MASRNAVLMPAPAPCASTIRRAACSGPSNNSSGSFITASELHPERNAVALARAFERDALVALANRHFVPADRNVGAVHDSSALYLGLIPRKAGEQLGKIRGEFELPRIGQLVRQRHGVRRDAEFIHHFGEGKGERERTRTAVQSELAVVTEIETQGVGASAGLPFADDAARVAAAARNPRQRQCAQEHSNRRGAAMPAGPGAGHWCHSPLKGS